nr:alpha/beta fold hydrolase [Kineosporia mesophila]
MGFCGGGTGAFRGWVPRIPADHELVLVCYPGREGRFGDGLLRSWDALAEDTARVVGGFVDRPYTLFGHSMGGWMAFDVTGRLHRAGAPTPEKLVISSCNSPERGVTERDRFPRQEDSDDDLVAWMQQTGALPDYVASDPDLREMAVELMRADVQARDSYCPDPAQRVPGPVQVLYGIDDPVIDPAVRRQWQAVVEGECRVGALPGGHFYTPDIWEQLPIHFPALTTTRDG